MKRSGLGVVLAILVLAPALMGGGGSTPPGSRPSNASITGPKIEAIFVMDPHQDLTTDLPKHAAVYLRWRKWFQPDPIAATVFQLPLDDRFQLLKGCDLTFTDLRFVNTENRANTFQTFFEQAGYLRPLFADLGITITAKMKPVITRVKKQGCTTGGAVPGFPGAPSNESKKGMLWMVAEVQFQVEP